MTGEIWSCRRARADFGSKQTVAGLDQLGWRWLSFEDVARGYSLKDGKPGSLFCAQTPTAVRSVSGSASILLTLQNRTLSVVGTSKQAITRLPAQNASNRENPGSFPQEPKKPASEPRVTFSRR
jgi:hypothetical protein